MKTCRFEDVLNLCNSLILVFTLNKCKKTDTKDLDSFPSAVTVLKYRARFVQSKY